MQDIPDLRVEMFTIFFPYKDMLTFQAFSRFHSNKVTKAEFVEFANFFANGQMGTCNWRLRSSPRRRCHQVLSLIDCLMCNCKKSSEPLVDVIFEKAIRMSKGASISSAV